MSTVGQIEQKTQQRVVELFRDTLDYTYLGNWIDREGNRNIEPGLLRAFLKQQGDDDAPITRPLHILDRAAGDTSKSLYDRNRAVYDLLRYGVKVKPDVGENTQTVWLIDWKPRRRTTLPSPKKSLSRGSMPRPTPNAPTSCSMSMASRSACWNSSAPPFRWLRAFARTSTTRRRSSSNTSSRRCSWYWRATTPRACAMAASRRRRSIT